MLSFMRDGMLPYTRVVLLKGALRQVQTRVSETQISMHIHAG